MKYLKKRIAWNKGKKCPYVSKIFKGKKLSLEHREKLRQAKLINPVRYWLGKKRPDLKNTNSVKTMFKQGDIPPWTGKKLPERSRENHWNWKGGPPKCLECRKILGTSSYKVKRCSRHRAHHLMGENSPHWRGGKGTERHKMMGRYEYRIWREAVFARDNWNCQQCNKRGGYLEADHIKPWSLYPELRYAIDNGRTLCRECHKQTDTWGIKALIYKEVDIYEQN